MTEAAEVRSISKKRLKFVELVEKRTSNAIKSISLIGKLGNRSAYEYGEIDVRKVITALTAEIEAVRAKMSTTGRKSDVTFKL